MIYVDISTRCPQRNKMTQFAVDVIESFFTHRFKRDVWIDIEVKNLDKGYYGFCVGDRDDVSIELQRKSDDGEMLSPKLIATNLAHELVHAKQYIKGQIDGHMRYRMNSKSTWEDHTDTSYLEQPWELEAYALEEELVERFWND